MPLVPTPEASVYAKLSPGTSDTTIVNGVYKFMGCSVLSVQMTMGFNGVASSLSVTLVEDIVKGDNFIAPWVPELHSFSLPKGGVGIPSIYITGAPSLHPNAFSPTNVPFYFTGICTNYQY